MSDRIFIDTNIFVYASLTDPSTTEKHAAARRFFETVPETAEIIISTQVLNEFYSVMLKNNLDEHLIRKQCRDIIEECFVATVTLDVLYRAWDLRARFKYSYWDSLVLSSAIENKCTVFYSEDMQHNQVIENIMRIVNPLRQ